jgi:sugar (pentulose or hexulose) kinase
MSCVFLGVDIGTTSAKCLAVTDQGEMVAFAQSHYSLSHPYQGWAEQDAREFYNALVDVVRQCVAECCEKGFDASHITALSLSSQGDTLIVTDSEGTPIHPAMSWMDRRAEQEYHELIAETGKSFWYSETGQPINPLSSACKIRWVQKHYSYKANRMRFCWVADFLAKQLCGEFVSDIPSASWTPLYSPVKRNWSAAVIQLLKVPGEMLPVTAESGTVIGDLLPDVASQLGLGPNTKLVAGAFDQASAALGAGADVDSRRGVLSGGTAWVLYIVSSTPPVDRLEQLCVCCHAQPLQWGLVLPFPGGGIYDWLNRNLGDESHEALGKAEPLIFIPHLYGGLSPDWQVESKGSLLGLTVAHSRGDFRLAVMRGIAFEARRNIEAAERLGISVDSIRMVGGAVKSEIWPQMIADILNRPVEVSNFNEAACLGVAKLAARQTGVEWQNCSEMREYDPLLNNVPREEALYQKYLEAYESLLQIYRNSMHE